MSVQWTVARAVGDGLIKDHLPFARTAKGGAARKPRDFQAFWEAVLGGLLVLGAIVLLAFNTNGIHEITIFAVVLMLQSLPFLSAAALAAIEGSRFNEFATWKELQSRGAGAVAQARRRHRQGDCAGAKSSPRRSSKSRSFRGHVRST